MQVCIAAVVLKVGVTAPALRCSQGVNQYLFIFRFLLCIHNIFLLYVKMENNSNEHSKLYIKNPIKQAVMTKTGNITAMKNESYEGVPWFKKLNLCLETQTGSVSCI